MRALSWEGRGTGGRGRGARSHHRRQERPALCGRLPAALLWGRCLLGAPAGLRRARVWSAHLLLKRKRRHWPGRKALAMLGSTTAGLSSDQDISDLSIGGGGTETEREAAAATQGASDTSVEDSGPWSGAKSSSCEHRSWRQRVCGWRMYVLHLCVDRCHCGQRRNGGL